VDRVHIPRSAQRRAGPTYALLVKHVLAQRRFDAFRGTRIKPGTTINEAELWPEPDYPSTPLLLEYAGPDRVAGLQPVLTGHRRFNEIYILWRYHRAHHAWVEVVRCKSLGSEWIDYLKPVALAELARTEPAIAAVQIIDQAAGITARVLETLDRELDTLGDTARELTLNFVYREFTCRVAAYD
jgi:hypothetical protein